MVFCAIFSLLLTSLMVFLDISHIALMFPFNWPKLVSSATISQTLTVALQLTAHSVHFQNAYLYFIISIIFIIGSSLLIHMVFFAHEYMWVPRHSKDTLFLSAVSIPIQSNESAAIRSFIIIFFACRCSVTHAQLRHLYYQSWASARHAVIVKCRPMNVIAS